MKKTLFLLMLLPFLGFSQTDLVRWNGASLQPAPTILQPNVTSGNISGSNVGFIVTNWGNPNSFNTAYWPNTATPDATKFIQFQIGANSGYNIQLSSLDFIYLVPDNPGGPSKFDVRYSTDSSFGTYITTVTTIKGSLQTQSIDLSGITVPEGQTIFIRLYAYERIHSWDGTLFRIQHGWGGSVGPTIKGTVSPAAAPVMSAVNDTYSISPNQATVLSVISNDNVNSSINSVSVTTDPLHGTAVANADKTITYTPAPGYIGPDSFTYTAHSADVNSTATVSLSVQQPTPAGALSGTYTIGNGGNFTTLTAAVAHLNAQGVSGPVTFLLTNELYTNTASSPELNESFPLIINQFTGSSLLNTVTFKPAADKNVVIKVNDGTNNYQATTLFWLNGADNIVFDGSNSDNGTTRNLTVFNNNAIDYSQRTVFWVASNGTNGANNITIKHTNIRQGHKNQGGNFCVGIYSGNNTLAIGDGAPNNRSMTIQPATANNSGLTVWNNDFMNVKQGVYINGGTNQSTDIVIHQNDLGSENNTETIIQPACLNNVVGFEFTENFVYNLYRDNANGSLVSSAMYVTGNSSNGSILKNQIRDLTKTLDEGIYFGGIVLGSTNLNSNILVANNFILNVSSRNASNYKGNGHGIIVTGGGGYKIYHNSVVLNTNQSGTGQGYSAALYVENGTALDVRNNIFVNNQTTANTRRTGIAVKNEYENINIVFNHLDYNTLYSTDAVAFIANSWSVGDIESPGSPDYLTTLGAWQNLTGADIHSVNILPAFVSPTDIHLSGVNPALAGTYLEDVPQDIDGQLRNTSGPTMGADEFGEVEMPEPGSGEGAYCETSTTWDGNGWSHGEPTADKDVIFTADKTFNGNGNNLNACSVFVVNGADVLFQNKADAIVVHNINVEEGSTLTFENNSHLIQIENTINTGNVSVTRESARLKRLDYTIWSSPTTGSQSLQEFSPQTLSNRFYIYNTIDDVYSAIADPSTTYFQPGKGYLIRVPNNFPENAPTKYTGVFEGVPNNGTIRIPLQYATVTNSYNMVGNPYPSPINIHDFIDANIDNIEGTIWVWRKTNDPSQTSYSVLTKAGYTANSAPGGEGNGGGDSVGNPYQGNPKGLLNTGQGFIIKAKNTQDLVFRNNMRITSHSNHFFRMDQDAPQGGMDISRIWLNVINADGVFTQTMIGYTPEATIGYDNGYDGKALGSGSIRMYSLIQDSLELAIQARPEFTINDVVRLGFTTDVAGDFEFTLDTIDGLFEAGQEIYLKDNLAGITHDIREGNYAFSSEPGTFNDRFEIVYTLEALGVNTPAVTAKNVMVYREGKQIRVQAPAEIQAVTVYDLLGRVLYQENTVNDTKFTSDSIDTQSQVVIVNVTLANQQVISKKIMME